MDLIYLDHNATTPIAPEVLAAMQPYLTEQWYNPSSAHRRAKSVRAALEQSREQVAKFMGAEADEVIFTSGGTESINTALRMSAVDRAKIVTTAVEHSAAFETLEELCKYSALDVVSLGVNEQGLLDMDKLKDALESGGVTLLNLLWANNETGVLQPVTEIIDLAHRVGVPVHVDAVQAAGKLAMPDSLANADFVSISAHKFNGPKGVGALRISKNRRFSSLISGGGQEKERRGGTENVPAIVGMAKAAQIAAKRLDNDSSEKIRKLRDQLEKGLLESTECKINGSGAPRLSNTSNVSFPRCRAEGLLLLLEESDLICSTGSACSSGKLEPSRILTAMGLSRTEAKSTLRFSLSHLTTEQEIQTTLEVIPKAVKKLESVQSSIAGPVVVYQGKNRSLEK